MIFFKKKIKYVLLPFLFFSSIDIIYYLVRLLSSYFFHIGKYEIYFDKIKCLDFINIYILGHTIIPIGLWYVPFIMVIFCLSNLYLKFDNLKFSNQLLLIVLFLCISMIIHRTHDNRISGVFQNVLYFTPVYLLGIHVSSKRQEFYSKILNKEFYLLLIASVVVALQILIGNVENLNSLSLISFKNCDLMIIQKSILSIFLIIWLTKIENKKINLLSILASNSFGIFFTHGIFIWLINVLVFKFNITYKSNSITIFLISSIFVLLLSLVSTIFIRKIFGKKSKYIIGC